LVDTSLRETLLKVGAGASICAVVLVIIFGLLGINLDLPVGGCCDDVSLLSGTACTACMHDDM
jgi:hypothetical protein